MDHCDTPRMKYQVSAQQLEDIPPSPTEVMLIYVKLLLAHNYYLQPTHHMTEAMLTEQSIDERIYDEVREYCNASPPIHMTINSSYAATACL